MFEPQSRTDIIERLKQDVNDVSTVEGTFTSDVLSATSIEFEKAYAELGLAVEAGFALTSWGEWLTKKCAELGVDRKLATKAKGVVKISGNEGARVIKGSLFATVNDTNFYTVQDAVIGSSGYVNVSIEAATAGKTGIVGIGTITKIPMSIPGVTVVTNEQVTYDGFDEESDKSLLERYLIKVRTPATSGNKYHYMQWAREVPGVGLAKPIPLWAGNGTVKVIITNADGGVASGNLMQTVYNHIEELRPIGAKVTVVSATPKTIKITASIKRNSNIEVADVSAGFTSKVNELFLKEGFKTDTVSIARIGKTLLECIGVEDYSNLKLNDMAENIKINADELPIAEVVLSDPQ